MIVLISKDLKHLHQVSLVKLSWYSRAEVLTSPKPFRCTMCAYLKPHEIMSLILERGCTRSPAAAARYIRVRVAGGSSRRSGAAALQESGGRAGRRSRPAPSRSYPRRNRDRASDCRAHRFAAVL